MTDHPETSDDRILDYLRRVGSVSVSDLVAETGVTATAVRQRLNRLMALGFVQREAARKGRGRPSHRYSLTEKGLHRAGTNYGDLALTLWEEIRSVRDPEVRSGLLKRIAARLAERYKDQVAGRTLEERLVALVEVMSDREVPVEVDQSGDFPVLTVLACPYPDLAERDRGVCAMEKLLFSEVIGSGLRLTECRLDGSNCCTFESASN